MQIDLSTLPAPQVVEELSFEAIFAAQKADLIARLPEIEPTLALESAVVNKVLQVTSYRELLVRSRVNDGARSVMLAFAEDGDLDQIGNTYGIPRQTVTAATTTAAAVMEENERYRKRIQLGIYAYSVAGPIEAYIFHALTADPSILDAAVDNPRSNRIELTILSSIGNGAASPDQLTKVADALSPNKARPLTDDLSVRSATIINQPIVYRLVLPRGPAAGVIEASRKGVASYAAERHKIGKVLRVDGIVAAARSGGNIERVIVESPAADVDPGISGAVFVPSIEVTTEVMT